MIFNPYHYSSTTIRAIIGTINLQGKIVADVGTGSGVLAECCLFNGAKEIYASDIDDEALDYARAKLERFENVHVIKSDLMDEYPKRFKADLILANLNPEQAYMLLQIYPKYLKKNGQMIITIPEGVDISPDNEIIYHSEGYEYNEYMIRPRPRSAK